MHILIQPLLPTDFPILHSHSSSSHGDLTAPVLPVSWPAPDSDASTPPARTARLHWSLSQQKHQLETDRTARIVKAVDSETGEILAIARWHRYPEGWDSDKMLWREMDPEEGEKRASEVTGETLPRGEGEEFKGWLPELYTQSYKWLGTVREGQMGHACWLLCTLKTRAGFRKRGAGSMLIKWGCDKADEDGWPAYLEGGLSTKPLYEKFGFKEMSLISFDRSPWGFGTPFTLSHMKREPGARAKGEEENEA